MLVLAAGTSEKGPGPLVAALSGRDAARLRIPITLVPGSLDPEAIDRLA